MIRFTNFIFRYPKAPSPTISVPDLVVKDGEFVLVAGDTGSGKSTFLRAMNGLVPHFSGGEASGTVDVFGLNPILKRPSDFSELIGYVDQDPSSQFVTDRVEDEIAFVLENLGYEQGAMRRRVEDSLDLLSISDLRKRSLRTLSGGQAQRVAIASVMAVAPKVLILDEPTSALDPGAADEVMAVLQRLVDDLGTTILMAEHRLERVLPYVDRVIHVTDRGVVEGGKDVRSMVVALDFAPPVVEFSKLYGGGIIALSVKEARRMVTDRVDILRLQDSWSNRVDSKGVGNGTLDEPIATLSGVTISRLGRRIIEAVSFDISRGQSVILMGRNGSGKSSLLRACAGLDPIAAGRLRICGLDPFTVDSSQRISTVGFVPQDPGILLFGESVEEECRRADESAKLKTGTTAAVLAKLAGGIPGDAHPRDLSEGERLLLAIAVVISPRPSLLLLDEPTRGLDYGAKSRLLAALSDLQSEGVAILMATHDVEVAAKFVDTVVMIGGGSMISHGPTRELLTHSPLFAPSMYKVLAPVPVLSVSEALEVLGGEG
ncbi:MAG: ATP-binding cassette domain-containing protein [Actinomycetota bacterium]|nr:ATP-binding cassette domain-containing protein [Actinomycetota bacterium]